jgi:ankyrin repeat protein
MPVDYRTPLARAAARGDTQTVRECLRLGAEVDAYDNDGYTPLARAALGGHTETVLVLAQRGADINTRDL